jgi:transketolase
MAGPRPLVPAELSPTVVAEGIRRRVLEHTLRHGGGYLSQALSSAEILSVLYTRVMRLGPSEGPPVPGPFAGVPGQAAAAYRTGGAYNGPHAPDLDRFYLSPAHYALVLYACLIACGRMGEEGLGQFNLDGSTVEMIGAEHSPGMEVTTGSLGQGLSQALGAALARKLRGEPGRTWVFMSDGELQEGQTWEALSVARFHALDAVGVYVDVNGQQCDGRMADVLDIGDARAKLEAFGAVALEVDGHDIAALESAASTPHPGRPLVVLCRTRPYQGLDILQARAPKYHYVRFASSEERQPYEEAYRAMAGEGAAWRS